MPNVVKLLRSTTPGAAPASLVSGQIAINEADGKLFWLSSNGVTIKSATLNNLDAILAGKLTASNNLSDLTSPVTARANLGLGSAATLTAGTAANNAVQLDASARLPALNGSQLTNIAALSATSASSATLATKSSTLAQGGANGAAMTFNWSGQSGQPSWLWGGNDGVNHYVWNPANFSVNNAANLGGVAASSYALKSDVPVLITTLSGSAVGSLAHSSCFSSAFRLYEVVLENVYGSVNGAALYLQLHVGSYQASGYSSYTAIWNPGGAAGYYYTTFIDMLGGGRLVSNATWGGVSGVLWFVNPASTTYAPHMLGRTSFADATYGPYAAWTHISAMRTALGAVTGFQLYPSSGTITGTIRIYGRA